MSDTTERDKLRDAIIGWHGRDTWVGAPEAGQIADVILANYMPEHDKQVRREAEAEQREKDAQIAEASTRPRPGHGSLNEGSRSTWYAHGRRDAAAAIREQ